MAQASVVLVGHDVYQEAPPRTGVDANITASVAAIVGTIEHLQDRGWRFTQVDEFLEDRRAGNLALLTFDDAYRSVYEVVFPYLRAKRIPVVMFVVSQTLADQGAPFPLWLHALRDSHAGLPAPTLAALAGSSLIARIVDRHRRSLAEILELPLDQVTEIFRRNFTHDELLALGGLAAQADKALGVTATPDQLREMVDCGLTRLGAHSATHRSFASLSKAEISSEIVSSVTAVSAFAGVPAKQVPFAYPYGAVTTHAERVVAECCAAGFTCRNRPISVLDGRAALPRVNLDSRALERIDDTSRARRDLSWASERAHLNLRTGPLWKVLGPIHRRLSRRARDPFDAVAQGY